MRRLAHTNRPARLFIRSDDAIDRAGSGNPGDFQMPLREPILEAKGVQLLSARIPNIFPQVPDYQRWFIYVTYDYQGFRHIRGFRLCASTERQRYFANYADIVEQLNDDAKYWVELDAAKPLSTSRYLSLALTPGTPDVQFEYDARNRKINTRNVCIAPPSSIYQLVSGFNNVMQISATDAGGNIDYRNIVVAPGLYANTADLAVAMTNALSVGAVPLAVSSPVNGQLQYTWIDSNVPITFALVFNATTNYPVTLAQNSALAFGFSYPYTNTQVIGNSFVNNQAIPFDNPTAPSTLQLASVAEAAATLVYTELVKNYLFLNQILGYNVGELQPPSGPVATGGVIVPVSFCDLVRTQTIYIQSNLTLNGTMCSNGMRNIIQTIPVNVPQLGVISYQSSQAHYIWNTPENIMNINIKLIDENGQPLPMTLNAQTEFELGFLYDDSELPIM